MVCVSHSPVATMKDAMPLVVSVDTRWVELLAE
jgi:hypothetical protein